jgi:type IV pilus assembly protein PilQ
MLAPEDDEPTITEAKIAPPKNEIGAALAFAGYTKQRITVDFYKIDLHNVFRLFGEISNLNMVVDQAVGGSLTLALNDVPWDFALDIILNLKDLRKEERYNTIVISPKSKKFEWPERTLASVEFKEDTSINFAQQDDAGIKINQLQEIPETVVQAKNLIHQAQELEKLGNYTSALALYEEAFDKWPENTIIAKRIAALCLVHLGQNAKSVHYAKVALKADPNDYNSALQAAIGFARMEKTEQAKEYFEKSVSGPMPPSAALASYAAFSEELQQLDKALLLLKQHEDLHGDSLETMISKARIHDKQGRQDLASSEYHSILLSGYEIPADLARYIKGRASLAKE